MDRSDAYMILVIVVVFIVGAFALGLRDKINARKALIKKLQKEYGSEPHRNYKERDREHLLGFFKTTRRASRSTIPPGTTFPWTMSMTGWTIVFPLQERNIFITCSELPGRRMTLKTWKRK